MYERSERLKELFRQEIVSALRGVKDPGLSGLLTVTDVELSADRKLVKVFYSIIGDERQRKSAAEALKRSAAYIRHVLRKRVQIKVIPEVVFEYDVTPQRASRIDKLLLDLEKEKEGR